ncbi:MAG: SHOCT domain-containing protein [Solirubrobacterales bacterium]|nr:SHOCT domain-containing protein [Solirubrobacterales bacterium]
MLEYPDANYSSLKEFGERTRDRAKGAWAGRPKNINLPKIGGKDEKGEGEAETAVLGGPSAPAAAAPPAPAPAAAPEGSRLDRLEQLGRLKDAGVLDDEEFAAEKKRILGSE